MDHEQGIMMCREAGDVYATQEPAAAFHGRTAFCLDIHNEVRCGVVAADCSVSASSSPMECSTGFHDSSRPC